MSLATAVLARLESAPALNVGDGGAPAGAIPRNGYVSVHVGDGHRSGDRMVVASRSADLIITTHAVGLTTDAARIIRAKVRDQLLDHVLDVPGWQCWPITHDVERAPDKDESTGTAVIDAVDQWRLHAERTNEPEA